MKIVRYLDAAGRAHHGSEQPDGTVRVIEGDIYGAHTVGAPAREVKRLLRPVEARSSCASGSTTGGTRRRPTPRSPSTRSCS